MNKQQLASRIWESANKMRSKIEANEYKDYILGFIFYKFLSEKEVQFCKQNDFSDGDIKNSLVEEDTETVGFVQRGVGYFISYENLYSTWIEKGKDFEIANVRDALSAFSRLVNSTHKKVFDGIFDTLQTGLSKLGTTTGEQTKAASDLIHLIKDIPMDNKQNYDVLGFIYEYLISNFAANAGKKAGEFYTPHEVSVLIAQIVAHHLRGKEQIRIYDSTSGSGSLLINIGQAVAAQSNDPDDIKYYAQELKENTYNLTRMNLVMRGIRPDNIVVRNGDTLEDDWPYFEDEDRASTYQLIPVDAVVSNPPYSQSWDPSGKDTDPRYKYGLAPKSTADYAFLLHDLYHLRPDGIMAIVLPHGVLFRGGSEGEIRKNLIEHHNIQAIIGLPSNIFFGTGIPTIVMILRQKRDDGDVLIVDASKGFEKAGKSNKLRARDIKKIVDTVTNDLEIEKYSRKVSIEEIRDNDYNLNVPRYVDSSEDAETWDIYASMFGGIPKSELAPLADYWKEWHSLYKELFVDDGTPYLHMATDDIKDVVENNADVANFKATYAHAFEGWDESLKAQLVEEALEIDIPSEEEILAQDVFKRIEEVPFTDKYTAYQILDDSWASISNDLEILQTEGLEAANQVDPHMVTKKKGGQDIEVQEGWEGHVIPFDLVEQILFSTEASDIKEKENRLNEISAQYDEIIENMDEEEKSSPALNEDNTAFVRKEVTRILKEERERISTPEIFELSQYAALCDAKASTEDKLNFVANTTNVNWSCIERNKNGTFGKSKVQARIKTLRREYPFEVNSFEEKLAIVSQLFEEETSLKKEIKTAQAELQEKIKSAIKVLDVYQIKNFLNEKWIAPLVANIADIPDQIVDNVIDSVRNLSEKYAVTYSDIESEIKETEQSLLGMIDDLRGNEYDMRGLQEFKALLGGE